jgi:predicted regulator of Ras-like GTPase activity (Roadblock/LC7/MglB family)
MKNTDLTSTDERRMEAALEEFTAGSGARSAALVDRQGSVLARTGLPRAGRVGDLATLAARIHASGRRIGELSGSGEVGELVAVGRGGRVTVQELGTQGGPVLLLSLFEPDADAGRASRAVETLRGAMEGSRAGLGPLAALEDTMLERLDQTFPAE